MVEGALVDQEVAAVVGGLCRRTTASDSARDDDWWATTRKWWVITASTVNFGTADDATSAAAQCSRSRTGTSPTAIYVFDWWALWRWTGSVSGQFAIFGVNPKLTSSNSWWLC